MNRYRQCAARAKRIHLTAASWRKRGRAAVFLTIVALLLSVTTSLGAERLTALDRYVHSPDPYYHYKFIQQTEHAGYTTYLLQMTSQKWLTRSVVNRTLWKHWITIYRPDKVSGTTGMLLITGGSNTGRPPGENSKLASMATTSHTIISVVHDVPNQPLTFANDAHGPRHEDQIVAYTWKQYLKTGNPTWIVELPMTEAAVRAMDTVTSFMETSKGGNLDVRHFVVAGASKRGWTTWLTAAVDPRVVAIVPMVIDLLNVIPSFQHHYRVYGFWSPAITDYYDEGIMDQFDGPGFRKLMSIIDPYSYRRRLTMPKLLINAAAGQFFTPDSSRFYFAQLPGEKYLRYEPNANHSLKGTDAYENLAAFYLAIVHRFPLPRFHWKFEKNGSIRVVTEEKPLQVKLWQATNPLHRDFRVDWVGPLYKSSVLQPTEPDVYVARVRKPPKGWTAAFVELAFPGPEKDDPLHFTTAVRILPDTLPYPAPVPGKTVLGPLPHPDKWKPPSPSHP